MKHEKLSLNSVISGLKKYCRNKFKELMKKEGDNKIEQCRDTLKAALNDINNTEHIMDTHNIFAATIFIDFNKLRKDATLELCIELLQKNIPVKLVEPLAYNEDDPKVLNLMNTLTCYSLIRKIIETVDLRLAGILPDSVEKVFCQYPRLWVQICILKADDEVNKLLKHIREESSKIDASTPDCIDRQDSHESIVLVTLRNFLGVKEGCWKSRNDLHWPGVSVKLDTEFMLIEAFRKFERIILDQFQRLHLEDEVYDAGEMCETVELLEKLSDTREEAELRNLESELANDSEAETEAIKLKIDWCLQLLDNNKEDLLKEIDKAIHAYCEGRKAKIKEFVKRKMLCDPGDKSISPDSSLMAFIDGECKIICQHKLNNRDRVVIKLWDVVEDEICQWFEMKKKRNNEKNKPGRFSHVRPSLEVLMREKTYICQHLEIIDFNLLKLENGK